MNPTHLCVGGPLDGQHRSMPPETLSFRIAALAPVRLMQPHRGTVEDVIEYQLVWSGEHNRFVWWSDK